MTSVVCLRMVSRTLRSDVEDKVTIEALKALIFHLDRLTWRQVPFTTLLNFHPGSRYEYCNVPREYWQFLEHTRPLVGDHGRLSDPVGAVGGRGSASSPNLSGLFSAGVIPRSFSADDSEVILAAEKMAGTALSHALFGDISTSPDGAALWQRFERHESNCVLLYL